MWSVTGEVRVSTGSVTNEVSDALVTFVPKSETPWGSVTGKVKNSRESVMQKDRDKRGGVKHEVRKAMCIC